MHVIVLNGGGRVLPGLASVLPTPGLVIAADSGAEHAAALGLRVDRLIGDLDSIEATTLAALEAQGTEVERHPAAKDATDLDLALEAALHSGATAVTVVGGAGDRLDHLLGAVAHLGNPRYDALAIDGWFGSAQVVVVRAGPEVRIDAVPGEYVSLLALGGPVGGVTTSGLAWPLADADLAFGSTLGVSNEASETVVQVRVRTGRLFVVRPYAYR